MPRFGPDKIMNERNISPTRSRSISPNKRKPFISTTKMSNSFGQPPPLPPLSQSLTSKSTEIYQEDKQLENNPSIEITNNSVVDSSVPQLESFSKANLSNLFKQSIRWIHLSSTFSMLTTFDAHRIVDSGGISSFFEVINWRAHGRITEEEFTVLYSEWMALGSPDPKSPPSKTGVSVGKGVGVIGTRKLLLENACLESDLDLYIGMMIHECNRGLLGSPIHFPASSSLTSSLARSSIHPGRSSTSVPTLEVCSSHWLSLSEELFFALDAAGYGVLRFDEMFLLAACLVAGMQGWESEEEAEADLSLGVLASITLQMMKECGTLIPISGYKQPVHHISLSPSDPSIPQSLSPFLPPAGKLSVSLPMFKAYLMRRSIGEEGLSALLSLVRGFTDRLNSLASQDPSPDLFASFRPLESPVCLGAPRLWQQSVVSTSQHPSLLRPNSNNNNNNNNSNQLQNSPPVPPALLFLLSDADHLIPGAMRACERRVRQESEDEKGSEGGREGWRFVPLNKTHPPPYSAPFLLSPSDELFHTARRLCVSFQSWCCPPHPSDPPAPSPSPRDPLLSLILCCLYQYKDLQHRLVSLILQCTFSCFPITSSLHHPRNSSRDTHLPLPPLSLPPRVGLACASLMPNAERMMIELGVEPDPGPSASVRPSPISTDIHIPPNWDDEEEEEEESERVGEVLSKHKGMREGKGEGEGKGLHKNKDHRNGSGSGSGKDLDGRHSSSHPSTSSSSSSSFPHLHPSDQDFLSAQWTEVLTPLPLPHPNLDPTPRPPLSSRFNSQAPSSQKSQSFSSSSSSSSRLDLPSPPFPPQPNSNPSPSFSSSLNPNSKLSSNPPTSFPTQPSFSSSSSSSPKNPFAPTSLPISNPSSSFQSFTNPQSRPQRRSSLPAPTSSSSFFFPPTPVNSSPPSPSIPVSVSVSVPSLHLAPTPTPIPTPIPTPLTPVSFPSPQASQEEALLVSQILLAPDPSAQLQLIEKLRALRENHTQNQNNTQNQNQNSTSTSISISTSLPPPPLLPPPPNTSSHPSSSSSPLSSSLSSTSIPSFFPMNPPLNPPNNNLHPPHSPSAPHSPHSPSPQSDSLSLAASSIQDLLHMGQNAGKYAQTLREILRKMSRDNSDVQLQSLEEILQLGQRIASNEKETRGGGGGGGERRGGERVGFGVGVGVGGMRNSRVQREKERDKERDKDNDQGRLSGGSGSGSGSGVGMGMNKGSPSRLNNLSSHPNPPSSLPPPPPRNISSPIPSRPVPIPSHTNRVLSSSSLPSAPPPPPSPPPPPPSNFQFPSSQSRSNSAFSQPRKNIGQKEESKEQQEQQHKGILRGERREVGGVGEVGEGEGRGQSRGRGISSLETRPSSTPRSTSRPSSHPYSHPHTPASTPSQPPSSTSSSSYYQTTNNPTTPSFSTSPSPSNIVLQRNLPQRFGQWQGQGKGVLDARGNPKKTNKAFGHPV